MNINTSRIDLLIESKEDITGNVFIYDRPDLGIIFRTLSPIRQNALKAVPILHYFGVASNLIAIIILSKKRLLMLKGIFFLLLLAYSDFMYNFMSILPNVLELINIVDYDIFTRSNFACFFYDSRIILFHFYSVSLTLFATFDRFVHIYRPLRLNRLIASYKSKFLTALLLFLICVVLSLPHGHLFVYDETLKTCDANQFFKEKFLNTSFTRYEVFFMFIEPTVIWFIPGFLILFMNSYVIYKIIESSRIKSKTVGKLTIGKFFLL